MDRVTLDTNVLRDLAWCEGDSSQVRYGNDKARRAQLKQQFATLLALRDQGRCELGITTQVYTDYGRDTLPPPIQALIGPYVRISTPGISTIPLAIPFVIANTEDLERIQRLVFPTTQPCSSSYQRARKDALQLYAHKVAGRDFFITSDTAILRAGALLRARWGIQVLTLEQYISMRGEPIAPRG